MIDTLRKARELISTPAKWTQGEWARDSRGNARLAVSPHASCYCLTAAVLKASLENEDQDCIHSCLKSHLGVQSLTGWNDAPERTHAEVLLLLDQAIEQLETESNKEG